MTMSNKTKALLRATLDAFQEVRAADIIRELTGFSAHIGAPEPVRRGRHMFFEGLGGGLFVDTKAGECHWPTRDVGDVHLKMFGAEMLSAFEAANYQPSAGFLEKVGRIEASIHAVKESRADDEGEGAP